jgi:cobyrinic acid a,c-diamide synthase
VSGATLALPRLLIGGVSSGVGKTTFTVGLCRALMRRGLRVQLFKCGPDYLDPTYHRKASGCAVHNLDSWLMGAAAVRGTFTRNAAHADISLIEGVMGLFDGASPTDLSGSSAEIAQLLDCPIVLMADAGGMARTLSAVVKGFTCFEPGIAPRAVIANRIGSAGHLSLLQKAQLPEAPVLGGLLKRAELGFAERHLGLVAAQEADHEAAFEAWADEVEAHCDVPALLQLARDAAPLPAATPTARSTSPRCRIGVARDAAFHFYYDENLRLLEAAGAQLVEFSPLTDADLPSLDGVYIGGGYPELHAAQLAANTSMRAALTTHARTGKPLYAECGGLMYLSEALVDLQGQSHPMLGLVPGRAIMQEKLQALGYVEVTTRAPSPLGAAGTRYRGHQFRYSMFESGVATQLDMQVKRTGKVQAEGYGKDNVLASYVHGHWASNPQVAEAFVRACSAHYSASHYR